MTSEKLNQLFAAAREIPAETAPEQVADWVGAAAASSAGVLGVAAKLKLFIAKKTFIMLGISLGAVGVVFLSTAIIGSSPSTEEKITSKKETVSSTKVSDESELTNEQDSKKTKKPSKPVADDNNNELSEITAKDSETLAPMPIRQNYRSLKWDEGKTILPGFHAPDRQTIFQPKNKVKGNSNGIKGNGEVIKQERSVKPFSEIYIKGAFDVVLSQGTEEKVIVETDSNLQECVVVENDGSVLELKNSKSRIKKSTKMVVYVTVKDLSKIRNTGVGDIVCDNALKSKTMELVLSNVGDVKLIIDCAELNVEYSGVGDLSLSGSAKKSKINTSAVGDLKAFDLLVETMNILHTGVGDVAINVSKELILDFRGVGDVRYKGSPDKKDITKAGVGSVKKKS